MVSEVHLRKLKVFLETRQSEDQTIFCKNIKTIFDFNVMKLLLWQLVEGVYSSVVSLLEFSKVAILGYKYIHFQILMYVLLSTPDVLLIAIFNYMCYNSVISFSSRISIFWSITVFLLSMWKLLLLFSHVWLFETSWTVACRAPLSSTISWSLHKFMSIESVTLSNHFIFGLPLLLLPLIFPRNRVFSDVSSSHQVVKALMQSFSFSISPSNEYSVLISFRIDWYDFLAVQGTLRSFQQHCNSKTSILQCFFMVQLSHPYMTAGKIIALTTQNFCQQRDVSDSFPSKEQVSFNFMVAVTVHSDFGAQENKICHCLHFPPSICHEVTGAVGMIVVFSYWVPSQLFTLLIHLHQEAL